MGRPSCCDDGHAARPTDVPACGDLCIRAHALFQRDGGACWRGEGGWQWTSWIPAFAGMTAASRGYGKVSLRGNPDKPAPFALSLSECPTNRLTIVPTRVKLYIIIYPPFGKGVGPVGGAATACGEGPGFLLSQEWRRGLGVTQRSPCAGTRQTQARSPCVVTRPLFRHSCGSRNPEARGAGFARHAARPVGPEPVRGPRLRRHPPTLSSYRLSPVSSGAEANDRCPYAATRFLRLLM